MKRRIALLMIFLLFIFTVTAWASDAQRMVSSGVQTTNASIKTSPGKIYGIILMATAANAEVAIYDTSGTDPTGKTILYEIVEATQYDSITMSFPEGLNAYEGIYLGLNANAEAIIYYY